MATIVICKQCGKSFEFDKKRQNRKFCNIECRNKYYGKTEKTFILKTCRYCGKEFQCPSSTPTRVFCGDLYKKEYYKAMIEPRKIVYEKRKCQYCGNEFTWASTKANQVFCSNECQKKSTYEKTHKDIISEKRKCEFCEKEFIWYSNKSNQKYCSTECRQKATYNKIVINKKGGDEFIAKLKNEIYIKVTDIIGKMYQKGNAYNGQYIDYWKTGDISEKTREEVLARDHYECWICKM